LEPTRASRRERKLVERCLNGDADAVREFQETYGELIYGYPMHVYRVPAEEAGDFYLYALDRGRIFRRVRTFAGRTTLRHYLLGWVLDNLVLEWKRGRRAIETVPADSFEHIAAADEQRSCPNARPDELLATLDPSKAVLLKLLYIEDFEIDAADMRQLKTESGRTVRDLLDRIEALRRAVRRRESRAKEIDDALDTVYAWSCLYERHLWRVRQELAVLPPDSEEAARLRDEGNDLERNLRRRRDQRSALLAGIKRRKITGSYKDIADILNTTVGNVASRIKRLRDQLERSAADWLPAIDGDE
jgi:DNA-directed RNA polymerase specialized sigma24 family protein